MADYSHILTSPPRWLASFDNDPETALDDLLRGRADLGMLSAEEPTILLFDWLRAIKDEAGFAGRLDAACLNWITRNWGQSGDNVMWPVIWTELMQFLNMVGVEELPFLNQTAAKLKELVLKDQRFLDELAVARSRDPFFWAWHAIANRQEDRSLYPEWIRFCGLRMGPWYRGACGIKGLRTMPTIEGDKRIKPAGFSIELADGLLILGTSLWAVQEQREVAEDEILPLARLAMGIHLQPLPQEWGDFWRHVIQEHPSFPRAWAGKLVEHCARCA